MNAKRVTRSLAIAGAIPVGSIAAWVSYWHTVEVVSENGQTSTTAHLMPLSVEGMLLVSAVAIYSGQKGRLPRWTFGLGVAAVLGANVASVDHISPIAIVAAVWPAVALVLTSKMLLAMFLKPPPPPRRPAPRQRTRKAATRV